MTTSSLVRVAVPDVSTEWHCFNTACDPLSIKNMQSYDLTFNYKREESEKAQEDNLYIQPINQVSWENIAHYILCICTVAVDLPAPLPLLLSDFSCLVVVKVQSPLVSIVQLVVLVQQFFKCVHPQGRNPVCMSGNKKLNKWKHRGELHTAGMENK